MKCWSDILTPIGYNVTKEFYNAEISGGANSELAKKFYPNHTLDEQMKLMNDKEAHARELFGTSLVPLPGLLELISYLKQHSIKLAAVTNAPKLNAYFMLDAIKLTKEFDEIILAEQLQYSKPHPLPYHTAMNKFNVQPSECIIFEDSLNGCKSGVSSTGCTVGVATTHTHTSLQSIGVNYVVNDFSEIKLDESLLNIDNFVKTK